MNRLGFLILVILCSAERLFGNGPHPVVMPTYKVLSGVASADSEMVGLGNREFTTAALLDAPIGALCKVTRVTDTNIWMFGRIKDITSSSITVDVKHKNPSTETGNYNDWKIDIWDSPAVRPQMFGAAGNGTTDDTIALRQSWEAADKLDIPVYIPGGSTFRIASAATSSTGIYTGTVWLVGEGTIKCDNDLPYATQPDELLTITGNVTIDGITIDGNDNCRCFVKVFGGTSIVRITNTTFTNFDSDAFANPVWIYGPIDKAFIKGCTFSDITALKAATGGGTLGTAIGILISNGINFASIESCVFDNINNRTSTGTKAYQDADAINIFSTTNKSTVHVRGCWFNNIGKRAVKFNTVSGSHGLMQDCDVISGYTGTPDTATEPDNGMLEVVAAYGGGVDIANVRLLKGVIQNFASAIAACDYVSLTGCRHTPEPHNFVHGAETAFVAVGTNFAGKNISAANCVASGVRRGFVIDSIGGHFKYSNNEIQSMFHAFYILNGGSHTITGNVIRQDPYNDPPLMNRAAVRLQGNMTVLGNVVIAGNSFDDMDYGIDLANQTTSGAYRLAITGNAFSGMDTQDFRNSDGADAEEYIVYADNASDKVSFGPPRIFTENLTDNMAISFVRIGVAPDATAAGICKYTIRANDGATPPNRQSRTGQFHFSINNRTGVGESAVLGTVINEAANATTGTLTLNGFTTDTTPANAVDIKCNADTSLTTGTITVVIDYQIQVTSGNPTIQSL